MDQAAVQRAAEQGAFRTGPDGVPSFGFTAAAIWIRIQLSSPRGDEQWLLEVEEPLLHQVDVFVGDAGPGPPAHFASGRMRPFAERVIKHRRLVFPLSLDQSPSVVYVRLASRDNLLAPLKLWPRDEFWRDALREQTALGLFYGSILALIAYNLFLLLSLRDANYAFYILYAASFAALQATIDGALFEWLPTLGEWWKRRAPLFSGLSAGFWMLLFLYGFLQMRTTPRWLRWPGWLAIGAVLTLFGLSFVDAWLPFVSRQANTLSSVTVFYALACAAIRTATGYKPARFFLLGWVLLFSGVFGAGLVNLGYIPITTVTTNLMRIGFVAELVLFSFALADRINLLREEKDKADRRILEQEQRTAAELEALVRQRTEQLSVAVATRDKFFSTIAHDLRGPIGAMSMLLDAAAEDGHVDDSLLAGLQRTARNSYVLLEELLTWARSQRGEILCRPAPCSLRELIDEAIALLRTQAEAKQIEIVSDSLVDSLLFVDRSMIATVLRNLLNNAIKFTPRGGKVRFDSRSDAEFAAIEVVDSGIGMSAERAEGLFQIERRSAPSPGTEGESGSGLGLILCREFVAKNGGEIGARCAPGAGCTFWFTAPLHRENGG